MIGLCTFRDTDLWNKPDSTGHNKVGYLTSDGSVIYRVRRHYLQRNASSVLLRAAASKPLVFELQVPVDTRSDVEKFFTENVLNPSLMEAGLQRLLRGDFEFFCNPIRLPKLQSISEDERLRRWELLYSLAEPGDSIFVIDRSSWISRAIAKFERGTWSHVAIYSGNGHVIEAITSGVTERPISVYNSPAHRIGVYRVYGMTPEKGVELCEYSRRDIGVGYSWHQAMQLAWKRLINLNIWPGYPVSPNDLAGHYNGEIVHLV